MITVVDNITYLLDSAKKCATVTKSILPYSGDIIIPAAVSAGGAEYAVVDILDEAFKDCTALHSVVLGDNIDSIGIGAFEGCGMLSSVKFNDALHAVGVQAFKGCTSLVEVVFPPKVLVIGRSAFAGCTALEKACLPDNLINIEPSLFDGCSSLTEVILNICEEDGDVIAIVKMPF